MEALLIYNPNAGGVDEGQATRFQRELEGIGFNPTYIVTKNEDDLDEALPQAKGIVVVVGGDGTLRAVTTRLVGRDIPIALIPNGTANNVGRTLGIEGDPLDIIQRLSVSRKVPVDMGRARFPWGDSFFLEGAGMGLFAEALSKYKPDDGKSFLRGIKTLVELLTDLPSRRLQVRLDGQEMEDDFLLLEAMNMGAIGPRISLAPRTNPSDGSFDFVLIRDSERESYLSYLSALLQDDVQGLESVERLSGNRLEIRWDGSPLHMDASCVQLPTDSVDLDDTWVSLEVMKSELTFLIPEPVDQKDASSLSLGLSLVAPITA